jgi:hypothetical protein
MLLSDEAAVRSIAHAIVHQRGLDERHAPAVGDFLLAVRSGMPDYLRLPFRMLTLAFDGWPLLRAGRPFHRLPLADRIAQIEAWRTSRIEARRRIVEFYETLAVFGLYSDLYGADYSYADRQ